MKIEVDERLFAFLPFYKAMLVREQPHLRAVQTEKVAREAMLDALEEAGQARRVRSGDRVRIEPTEEFLAYLGSSNCH